MSGRGNAGGLLDNIRGALWQEHLTPRTTMQIRVQINSGNSWKVRKTLKLIVR